MSLVTLTLENFRSFEQKNLALDKRAVIIGDNGAGKSTLIEAIRILSVGKSFRTSRFDEVIRFEAPYLRIIGQLTDSQLKKVEFFYGVPFIGSPKERLFTANGKAVDWLNYAGQFPSVLFVPDDIDLVIGAPQLRRRYLDSILWQIDPAFRQDHLDFSRVLRERSATLFLVKINRVGLDELQPWNELISRLTESIRQQRQRYVDYLQTALKGQKIGHLTFAVEYQPNKVELAAVQKQEIQTSQNLFGAHRDELEVLVNDRSARRFASRGQARTAVVLLKSVESRFLAEKSSRSPIILLDDLFSELDEENSRYLFEGLDPDYQVIVSAIKPNPLVEKWPVVKL